MKGDNEMVMFIDWHLAKLSSERHHPASDGSRYRDPQPNTRWSQGTPKEKRKFCRRQRD